MTPRYCHAHTLVEMVIFHNLYFYFLYKNYNDKTVYNQYAIIYFNTVHERWTNRQNCSFQAGEASTNSSKDTVTCNNVAMKPQCLGMINICTYIRFVVEETYSPKVVARHAPSAFCRVIS